MLPLVIQIEDGESHAVDVQVFRASPVHVGRNALNELVLPNGLVSQWHGVLTFDETGCEYIDLGSTNGSVLDGAPLGGNVPTRLGTKAELRIGPFRLKVSRDGNAKQRVNSNHTQFRLRLQDLNDAATVMPGTGGSGARSAPASASQPSGEGETVMVGDGGGGEEQDDDSDVIALYGAYRHAWERLFKKVVRTTDELPLAERPQALRSALNFLPDMAHEKQLQAYQESLQRGSKGRTPVAPQASSTEFSLPAFQDEPEPAAEPPRPASSGRARTGELKAVVPAQAPAPKSPPPSLRPTPNPIAEAALKGLRLFASTYGSERVKLASVNDVNAYFDRVAQALETFAKSLVEIRRGQEQFGAEMGVRAVSEDSPLMRARTPTAVLQYLLTTDPTQGTRELKRCFADVMVHQVAVLGGVREGVRALLVKLGPEAQPQNSKDGLFQRILQSEGARQWQRFLEIHRELTEEEGSVQALVFGPAFARAYTLASGRRAGGAVGERDPAASTEQRRKLTVSEIASE